MPQKITQSGIRTTQTTAEPQEFTVLLSPTKRGARLARRLAVQQLIDWDQPYDRAEQVTAELANNAVQHGLAPGRNFRLTLKLTPPTTLRIELTDTRADTLPHRPNPSTTLTESGRGLLLVEAFADTWGTDFGPTPQKTIWAELKLSKTTRQR